MSDCSANVPVDDGRVNVAEPLVSVASLAFIRSVSEPLCSMLSPLVEPLYPRN